VTRFEYAALWFAKVLESVVVLPNGVTAVAPQDRQASGASGVVQDAAVRDLYQSEVGDAAAADNAAWEESKEAWHQQVRIDRKRKVTVVEAPGWREEYTSETTDDWIKGELNRAHDGLHPRPGHPSILEWVAGFEPERRLGWRGWFRVGGETRVVLDFTSNWKSGAPDEIVDLLTAYGDDGWRVVSTSEDKGLFTGDVANDVNGAIRIRYLLERSSGS
jgi:hypothetical protein